MDDLSSVEVMVITLTFIRVLLYGKKYITFAVILLF